MTERRGAPIGPVASWSVLIVTAASAAATYLLAGAFLLPTPLPILLAVLAGLVVLPIGLAFALATKQAASSLAAGLRKPPTKR